MSYFVFDGIYSIVCTNTLIEGYFPYIIYYLSPLYVATYYSIELRKKIISQEQLIGISCGVTAAFFSILAIAISINRKLRRMKEKANMEISFSDENDQPYIINKNARIENNQSNKKQQDNSISSDFDFDFWL